MYELLIEKRTERDLKSLPKGLFKQILRDELGIDLLELVSSTELQQIVNLYFVAMMERAVNEIHREKGFHTAE